MGKRKKSTPKVQKRFYRLPKTFQCPFCNCPDSVHVKFDKKDMLAKVKCVKCKEGVKNIKMTPITEPIDIYDDWVDQVREANKSYNPTIEEQRVDAYEDEETVYEESRLQSNSKGASAQRNIDNDDKLNSDKSDSDASLESSGSDLEDSEGSL